MGIAPLAFHHPRAGVMIGQVRTTNNNKQQQQNQLAIDIGQKGKMRIDTFSLTQTLQ